MMNQIGATTTKKTPLNTTNILFSLPFFLFSPFSSLSLRLLFILSLSRPLSSIFAFHTVRFYFSSNTESFFLILFRPPSSRLLHHSSLSSLSTDWTVPPPAYTWTPRFWLSFFLLVSFLSFLLHAC